MEIDVIVGGQFGSEAKGTAAAYVAKYREYDAIVSVNTAQAGHTVPVYNEKEHKYDYHVLRQLPSAGLINRSAILFVGPGAIIDLNALFDDVLVYYRVFGDELINRLIISDLAVVIEEGAKERESHLIDKLGSTGEGVGYTASMRAMRKAVTINHASHLIDDSLSEYVPRRKDLTSNEVDFLNDFVEAIIDRSMGTSWHYHNIYNGYKSILLEGSQGFGLSNFYKYYPFCTSRDTTTAGLLSAAMLPPSKLREVYGVFRTYPIRVGGNSGRMYSELEWKDVAERSGYETLGEYTTVTKRLRRVGEWDDQLVKDSIVINGVTKPLITFGNYLNAALENLISINDLRYDTKGADKMRQIIGTFNSEGLSIDAWSFSKSGGWVKGLTIEERVI